MSNVQRLFGTPNAEALEVLKRNFDIAEVSERESVESLQYNLDRIEAAEREIQKIEDPKLRRSYSDWLFLYRGETEAALEKKSL